MAQMDVSGRSVVYFRTLMSLYNPLISKKFSSENLSFSDTVTHHKANAPHTSLTGSPHAGQRGAGTCYIQQGCTFATVSEPSMRTRCVYHSFRACATTSPPAALYVNGPFRPFANSVRSRSCVAVGDPNMHVRRVTGSRRS